MVCVCVYVFYEIVTKNKENMIRENTATLRVMSAMIWAVHFSSEILKVVLLARTNTGTIAIIYIYVYLKTYIP